MSNCPAISEQDALRLLMEFSGVAFRLQNAPELPAGSDSAGRTNQDDALRGISSVRELPNSSIELAINLRTVLGRDALAVGSAHGESADLLNGLPSMAAKYLMAQRQIRDYEKYLDSFSAYMSQHLEELTWLRAVAQQLQLCRVNQPLEEAARQFLVPLQQLVRAKQLAFVIRMPSQGDAQTESYSVVTRIGRADVSDAAIKQLIGRLADAARFPVVRNKTTKLAQLADLSEIESCVLVPVGAADHPVGWLVALNYDANLDLEVGGYYFGEADGISEFEFGTNEAGLMSTAAVMLATHVRNVAIFEEREQLLVSVIRCLVNALDAKDEYTRGHSERVAQIASRIGKELGYDSQACRRLYISGLLHDVGKIGVPDEVLRKTGKLTDEEMKQMQRHPRAGYEIMHHVEQIREVLPGVLHHHECVDGSGYPDKLAGEDIPLDARILAVADAYDAMTSCRPYRQAMPLEKAEAILKAGASKQWDKRVVDAFFAVSDDIRRLTATERQRIGTPSALTAEAGLAEMAPQAAL